MTTEEFIKLWNKTRRESKGKWIQLIEEVNGHELRLKSFGMFIQRVEYKRIKDGIDGSTVKQATQWLESVINNP